MNIKKITLTPYLQSDSTVTFDLSGGYVHILTSSNGKEASIAIPFDIWYGALRIFRTEGQ